jgi:hypothetical protein
MNGSMEALPRRRGRGPGGASPAAPVRRTPNGAARAHLRWSGPSGAGASSVERPRRIPSGAASTAPARLRRSGPDGVGVSPAKLELQSGGAGSSSCFCCVFVLLSYMCVISESYR